MTEEERDERLDLSAWPAEAPPTGFADRVLARVEAEASVDKANWTELSKTAPRKASRGRLVLLGGGIAAAAAALLLELAAAPPAHGSFIAKERTEVHLGERALAVLEPGASVAWDGDDVRQSAGDVFYRVEPGARFTVHTPAGDVAVKGTCFGVKVASEDNMQKRDLKTGAVGAAISALALVAVYEGKVSVSHASTHVELEAGEAAESGPNGVTKTTAAEGERAFAADVAKASESEDPTMAANKNLVRQLGEYRSRLSEIAEEKSTLEAKLQKTETALQAAQDGAPVKLKSDFDLNQEDWREMAKDGTIKYQSPCGSITKPWNPPAGNLTKLGLSPEDGVAIKNAYQRSAQRTWDQIRPLCAAALGSELAADRVGPDTCPMVIMSATENSTSPDAVYNARKLVGQIRAGDKPMPGPNDNTDPSVKLMLAMTGAGPALEADLAQSFGPEEAHRLMYSDDMCFGHHVWGGQPSK